MKTNSPFALGFKKMIPITTGVIPFGAVVGTVCADAGISFFQTMTMNLFVYAGAAQLASVELMNAHAASVVVIASGLVINLRFLLYSAALSPVLQDTKPLTKLVAAHTLTDQSYAVMSSYQNKCDSNAEVVQFYFGTATCMFLAWQLSVLAGRVFGNFAPASWALDFAIPLSFVALVIPTIKNKKYLAVAVFSSIVSIALYSVPYKLGLIITALLAISFAALITRKKANI